MIQAILRSVGVATEHRQSARPAERREEQDARNRGAAPKKFAHKRKAMIRK